MKMEDTMIWSAIEDFPVIEDWYMIYDFIHDNNFLLRTVVCAMRKKKDIWEDEKEKKKPGHN